MPVTIFLSAVSKEFHNSVPGHRFLSYRTQLANALASTGGHFRVIVQEELAQGFGDLLATLDDEVRQSDLIVHLVGDLCGATPEAAAVRRLRERHPKFLAHEPELAAAVADVSPTYTQWELYLAYHHRKRRLVYVAKEEGVVRSPAFAPDPAASESQQSHRRRVKLTGEHYQPFAEPLEVVNSVLVSLIKHRLDRPAVPLASAAAALARAARHAVEVVGDVASAIVLRVGGAVRATPAGSFVPALDAAAVKWQIDRREVLEIAERQLTDLGAAAENDPSADTLNELAFAELAVGLFHPALATARRLVAQVSAHQPDDPDERVEHQQRLVNAHLLVHEIADAAGRRDDSLTALEAAGRLIDADADPVLWADIHETLTQVYLTHARFDRMAELIPRLLDIRAAAGDPNCPRLAIARYLSGWHQWEVGRFTDAIRATELAVPVFAAHRPANPGWAAWMCNALRVKTLSHRALGHRADEESAARWALAVAADALGPSHQTIANATSDLAHVLAEAGAYEQAEELFNIALSMMQETMAPGDPLIGLCAAKYGELLAKTGRLAEGERRLREALCGMEAELRPDHHYLGIVLGRLAGVMAGSGRDAEAEPLLRRAVGIWTAKFGEEHLQTEKAKTRHAEVLARLAAAAAC